MPIAFIHSHGDPDKPVVVRDLARAPPRAWQPSSGAGCALRSAACPSAQVLLGWLHCQDKYLSKVGAAEAERRPHAASLCSPTQPAAPAQYSAALQERGYGTHQSVCPPATLFWVTPSPRRAHSRRVLADVQQRFGGRQIFFLTFSNGGEARALARGAAGLGLP